MHNHQQSRPTLRPHQSYVPTSGTTLLSGPRIHRSRGESARSKTPTKPLLPGSGGGQVKRESSIAVEGRKCGGTRIPGCPPFRQALARRFLCARTSAAVSMYSWKRTILPLRIVHTWAKSELNSRPVALTLHE